MSNNNIPLGIPIATPIGDTSQIIHPIAVYPVWHKCRDCGVSYVRKPEYKGTRKYFRCEACDRNFLSNTIISSCVIS